MISGSDRRERAQGRMRPRASVAGRKVVGKQPKELPRVSGWSTWQFPTRFRRVASKEQKTGCWSRDTGSGGFWGVLRFEKGESRTATQNEMPECKTEFVAFGDAGESKTLVTECEVQGGPLFPLPFSRDFLGSWVSRSRYTRLAKFLLRMDLYTYIHIYILPVRMFVLRDGLRVVWRAPAVTFSQTR